MNSSGIIKAQGTVTEALSNASFKVRLEGGKEIIAHLAGKLRMNHIRVMQGDRVSVEMSECDQTKGRIIFRLK
ncbi:MAG TPA: translation initiation factor IF-1 [Candidatus Pacearchaeota archaeon]|nr:translation initiation factor IF-1 [Candidatus Pacearchaeota archaeon]